MKKVLRMALFGVLAWGGIAPARAAGPVVDPATAAIVTQASPAVGGGVALVNDVVDIPKHTAEILLLPMGLIECVGSPLPGLEFMSGASHIGTGIVAPFKLVYSVLCLPADTVKLATGVSQVAAPGVVAAK